MIAALAHPVRRAAPRPHSPPEALRGKLDELQRRTRERPLDFATLLPWQRPLVALALGLDWRSEWGPSPTCPPTSITVVATNQIGKSLAQGIIIASHVTGRSARFRVPGEVWGGMPRLADSVATQRRHVEAWLGTDAAPRWWPTEANTSAESLLRTKQGWTARLKAYEQSLIAWESGTIQAAYLDEPPPDEIVQALRVRTMRERGLVLSIFTPVRDDSSGFHGTDSMLYASTWGAWTDFRAKHRSAKWGEVRPGEWVFALGIMENAESRGGYLPDARILADRQRLIDEGKPALALVRYGDPENDWRMEWVDMEADSLLPHDSIRDWSVDPPGGFQRLAAWIDVAYTANAKSCETAVSVCGSDREGKVYQIESEHGRWASGDRLAKVADVLARNGCPDTGIQRVGGDIVFADELNRELARRGLRPCVTPHPKAGHVPDKITRANQLAPHIAAGLFHVRPEHAEFKTQARKISAQYLKSGGLVDVVDAGIGAALLLFEPAPSDSQWDANEDARIRQQRFRDDNVDDNAEATPEWRLPASMFESD